MSKLRRWAWLTLVALVTITTSLLGRWQLHRLAARRAANAVQIAAQRRPPIELPRDLTPTMAIDSERRLVAHGAFDVAHQVYLRGRVEDDAPGLAVVTPFRLDSSEQVLWVIRGFVRSPDAATPPDSVPLPLGGDITIAGLAQTIATPPDAGRPLVRRNVATWQRLDLPSLRRIAPTSLPVAMLLAADSLHSGGLPVVAPPELTNGPHLSYAIQWFGIALAVLLFGIMVIWRGDRPSSRRPAAP